MHRKYLVVIERAKDGSFSAYVPDLPGCVSCAETPQAVKQSIRQAIDFHIQGLLEDGLTVPEPISQGEYVETSAA